MPIDRRTFITVSDTMPDHPKIELLSDRAFRLLIEGWCYCSKHLTDGVIDGRIWARRGDADARAELVDAGLVEADEAGSVTFHDYVKHQRTRADVEERTAKKSTAGALGNHVRWHKGAGQRDETCPHCTAEAATVAPSQDASHLRSIRESQTIAEVEVEVEVEKTPPIRPTASPRAGATDPAGFAAWYAAYPKHVGRAAALTAYRKALKKTDVKTLLTAVKGYDFSPDPQYVANPSTWLNQERWLDEKPTVKTARPDSQILNYHATPTRRPWPRRSTPKPFAVRASTTAGTRRSRGRAWSSTRAPPTSRATAVRPAPSSTPGSSSPPRLPLTPHTTASRATSPTSATGPSSQGRTSDDRAVRHPCR
jgi:hypothetical protein